MNTELLKLRSGCRTRSEYQFLYAKVQFILVPLHFQLVPSHYVCSGDGTDQTYGNLSHLRIASHSLASINRAGKKN